MFDWHLDKYVSKSNMHCGSENARMLTQAESYVCSTFCLTLFKVISEERLSKTTSYQSHFNVMTLY